MLLRNNENAVSIAIIQNKCINFACRKDNIYKFINKYNYYGKLQRFGSRKHQGDV